MSGYVDGDGWMAMGGFATLSQLSQNFLVFVVAFLLPGIIVPLAMFNFFKRKNFYQLI